MWAESWPERGHNSHLKLWIYENYVCFERIIPRLHKDTGPHIQCGIAGIVFNKILSMARCRGGAQEQGKNRAEKREPQMQLRQRVGKKSKKDSNKCVDPRLERENVELHSLSPK